MLVFRGVSRVGAHFGLQQREDEKWLLQILTVLVFIVEEKVDPAQRQRPWTDSAKCSLKTLFTDKQLVGGFNPFEKY